MPLSFVVNLHFSEKITRILTETYDFGYSVSPQIIGQGLEIDFYTLKNEIKKFKSAMFNIHKTGPVL